MNSQVKICGLARVEDYFTAVEAGPDAVGFVFWPKSPRAARPSAVADWIRERPAPRVRKVGVFVNQPLTEVIHAVEKAGLDVVQLHGDEGVDYMEALPVPVWKGVHLDRLPGEWKTLPVEALLVDSGTKDMPGGTGVRVDVERAAAFVRTSPFPVWLAGGLKAGTVSRAIADVRPFGVDVSSGVERAPGEKNPEAVFAFVRAARTSNWT